MTDADEEIARFPEFWRCPDCEGTGWNEWADCSWDEETGEEWCWGETCSHCEGKGYIIPAEPKTPWFLYREANWSWPDPLLTVDGTWHTVATHRGTNKRISLNGPTHASVVKLAEALERE